MKQQRQIAHLRSYIDRFRAKATKARQAQSRIKALERMEIIAAAHVDSPFSFTFAPVDAAARQLVRLENVTLGYADAPPVLRNVDWGVLCGRAHRAARRERRRKIDAAEGARRDACAACRRPIHVAAPAARLFRAAPGRAAARRSIAAVASRAARAAGARAGACAITWAASISAATWRRAPVARFSGGEKARLTLALIVRERPNLLLLDEPTNHLDIEMREALTEALQDYAGALIVVAHDRHLLRATVDELWLVADGAVTPFDGDLDDYRAWVLDRGAPRRACDDAPADADKPSAERRAQKRDEAQARQKRADARKPLLAAAGERRAGPRAPRRRKGGAR